MGWENSVSGGEFDFRIHARPQATSFGLFGVPVRATPFTVRSTQDFRNTIKPKRSHDCSGCPYSKVGHVIVFGSIYYCLKNPEFSEQ